MRELADWDWDWDLQAHKKVHVCTGNHISYRKLAYWNWERVKVRSRDLQKVTVENVILKNMSNDTDSYQSLLEMLTFNKKLK